MKKVILIFIFFVIPQTNSQKTNNPVIILYTDIPMNDLVDKLNSMEEKLNSLNEDLTKYYDSNRKQ